VPEIAPVNPALAAMANALRVGDHLLTRLDWGGASSDRANWRADRDRSKALWVIALIVFLYLGIFAYMITQARGMAERSSQQAQQAREELRRVVGFSAADEIEKLDRLKKSGSITDQEFTRLRAKLVA
jgi:hypothetical protein